VIGNVAKITDFGLFVRVADGVEGLAHISEISRDPKAKLDRNFTVGEPVRVRIIKIDWTDKKIGLSTRDVAALTEAEIAEHAAAAPPAEEHRPAAEEEEKEEEGPPVPETTPQG